jgi:hypothetical protein
MTVRVDDPLFVSFRAQGLHLCGNNLPPMREPEARHWVSFFERMLEYGLVLPREMTHADLFGKPSGITAADLGLSIDTEPRHD